MDSLDFIGYLRQYCLDNKIYFAASEEHYVNYTADEKLYNKYDMILCYDCTFSPIFGENGIESVIYNGNIALGRKREECTESNLDELFLQKYDNRLKELTKILLNILEEFVCESEIDVNRCDISYKLNAYDINIDFVVANVSLRIPYLTD